MDRRAWWLWSTGSRIGHKRLSKHTHTPFPGKVPEGKGAKQSPQGRIAPFIVFTVLITFWKCHRLFVIFLLLFSLPLLGHKLHEQRALPVFFCCIPSMYINASLACADFH